jgi:hypothetical protein
MHEESSSIGTFRNNMIPCRLTAGATMWLMS